MVQPDRDEEVIAVPDTVTKNRILVVDDAAEIREMLRDFLEPAGFDVLTAKSGTDGLRTLYAGQPNLVISDVSMPEMDGWLFLERMREFTDVPVIMLSALGESRDKVRGLSSGADDYLVKPITRAELLARIEAIMRRVHREAPVETKTIYQDGELFVDFTRHVVRVRGNDIDLSPQEFRMLATLVNHAGAVLSPERLMDLAWGMSEGGPENVRVYVGYLRKKLERDPKDPEMLETVRGFGYRYNPQKTAASTAA